MRLLITLSAFIFMQLNLQAQTTATFQEYDISAGEYIKDGGAEGGFTSGNLFLPNDYDATFEAWSGWAISSGTDTMTPGYLNEQSAITGEGFDDSPVYAVSYVLGESRLVLENAAAGGYVQGLYVTNTTYAYLSVKDGDAFAKKFGGESGNDPDFFLLTVKKYLNGQQSADSVNFYLADYRFSDNSLDYIVNDWSWLDLTSLGNADILSFSLSSSDNGIFGMNTPAYFAIDDAITADMATAAHELSADEPLFEIYPNPVGDYLFLNQKTAYISQLSIVDMQGRVVVNDIQPNLKMVDIASLSVGTYILKAISEKGTYAVRFIKH